MTELVPHNEQTVVLTKEEAESLHGKIVSGAKSLGEDLLAMYEQEGYKAMGHEHWGDYLRLVSEQVGTIGVKALRRIHNTNLFLHEGGRDIDEYREGTLRPILDILSDGKGYTQGNRERALEVAEEFAGDGRVTAGIAKSAAQYVAVTGNWGGEVQEDGRGAGDAANRLAQRMVGGEISTDFAFQIKQLTQSDAYGDPRGMEWLLVELGDVSLARFLINLKKNGAKAYEELADEAVATGHFPTKNGQVPVADATYADVTNWLDEPYRQQRYEKAVERTETFKVAAKAAAAMVIKYWGIHQEVPDSLTDMKEEAALYQALLNAGLIKYGMVKNDQS